MGKFIAKSSGNNGFFDNLISRGTKREDFCVMVTEFSICLKKVSESTTGIVYTELAERDIAKADALIIGKFLIDISYEPIKYNDKFDYIQNKGQGYQFYPAKQVMGGQEGVYTVDKSTALDPLKKPQIRLSVALDGEHVKHMTSLLRIYEITVLLDYIKYEKTEDELFKQWIACDTREMQINHITGDYMDSLKPELLEICTKSENLQHSAVLKRYRESCYADFAIFMATVEDCERATQELLQSGSKVRPVDKFQLIAKWETALVV